MANPVLLQFTEEALQELDELKGYVHLPNREDTIRHALRFLRWAVDETQSGGKLCLARNGAIREVNCFWE